MAHPIFAAVLFTAPRPVSIRAVRYCELYELSKENLDRVLGMFPDQAKRIFDEAELAQKMAIARVPAIQSKLPMSAEAEERSADAAAVARNSSVPSIERDHVPSKMQSADISSAMNRTEDTVRVGSKAAGAAASVARLVRRVSSDVPGTVPQSDDDDSADAVAADLAETSASKHSPPRGHAQPRAEAPMPRGAPTAAASSPASSRRPSVVKPSQTTLDGTLDEYDESSTVLSIPRDVFVLVPGASPLLLYEFTCSSFLFWNNHWIVLSRFH